MSESPPPDYGSLNFSDLWEILRLPVLLAVAAIAATWLVWYFTSASCSPELAETTGCNQGQVARYINLDILNKMMTHTVIAGGGGGIWSYAMITRQRKAIEALEQQLAEERQKASEERQKSAEERERFTAILAEEQRKSAEERAMAAEEREKAAEERRQLLALVESLQEQHNGSNGPSGQE